MNILVISQYYYPEQFRITDICEGLVQNGNKVTVVCGVPNYPKGEIYEGYEDGKRRHEIVNGVEIIRCENRPRHQGAVNLALNYISFVKTANLIVGELDDNYDYVFVYEISPISMTIPAIKYGRKHKKPVYLYCMDIWPESVRDIRHDRIMSKANPIFVVSMILSKWIYKSVDMIGIKCDQFRDYLVGECKVDPEKIVLLYEHAEDVYGHVSIEPDNNGCYDFYFLGNLGHTQNCGMIVDAAERVNTDKVFKVHFVGDGSDREILEARVKEKGLTDKIVFHDKCSIEETIPYYNNADCCLLTLSDRTASGITMPGKLIGYMAASRPVIASALGATEEIIEKANCGRCAPPNDVDSFAAFMQEAIDNPTVFRSLGKNGRVFFNDNFTLPHFLERLCYQFSIMK